VVADTSPEFPRNGVTAPGRERPEFSWGVSDERRKHIYYRKNTLWKRTYCGRHSARSAWTGEMELARNAGTSAAISADRASATIATETITGSY
jgi:hypothetical protein